LVAAMLALPAAAGAARAQDAPIAPPAPDTSTTSPRSAMPVPTASADTRKLIGRNIQNGQNETTGEIRSVYNLQRKARDRRRHHHRQDEWQGHLRYNAPTFW
jgi:hypothetical protein